MNSSQKVQSRNLNSNWSPKKRLLRLQLFPPQKSSKILFGGVYVITILNVVIGDEAGDKLVEIIKGTDTCVTLIEHLNRNLVVT